jgi:hypothetical protein
MRHHSRMGKRHATPLALLVSLTACGTSVTSTTESSRSVRDTDVAARRAMYDKFLAYPGSTKLSENIAEIRFDGTPTGHFMLEVTYQLPPGAKTVPVMAFYRAEIPSGWAEANDETCGALQDAMPPPPSTAPPPPGSTNPPATPLAPHSLRLTNPSSNLTVFLPGQTGPSGGPKNGLSIWLSVRDGLKLATFQSVSYGCSAEVHDSDALAFDNA